MRTKAYPAALLLLVGGVSGFLAGGLVRPGPAQRPEHVPDDPPRQVVFHWHGATPAPAPAEGMPEPPATLAATLQIDGDFAQTVALYQLLSDARPAELNRLIDEADTVPGAGDRRAALSIIYSRYADLDPVAALNHLQQRGGSYGDVELQAIFHTWARSDLSGAVAAASALTGPMREAAGAAILRSRDDLSRDAQRDIAQNLDIEAMMPGIDMNRSIDQVDRDPVAAWQSALERDDEDGRMRLGQLSIIARGWARDDPSAAMAAVAELTNTHLRAQLESAVLQQWARQDARQAVDWALARSPSAQRTQDLSTALAAMAGDQPRLAFDIARGLEGRERDRVVGAVLGRWAAADPATAARAIDEVTSPGARHRAVQSIATGYAAHDPRAGLRWAAGLEADEAALAANIMFSMIARQDPAHAADLVLQLPDAMSVQAAESVVSGWARQNPEQAARWVDTLTDDRMRGVATRTLVANWSQFDPDAAVRYAESIPVRIERETALVDVLQSQSSDPEFAARVFDRLTLPEQRTRAARALYLIMRQRDPERAERYRRLAGIAVQPSVSR